MIAKSKITNGRNKKPSKLLLIRYVLAFLRKKKYYVENNNFGYQPEEINTIDYEKTTAKTNNQHKLCKWDESLYMLLQLLLCFYKKKKKKHIW